MLARYRSLRLPLLSAAAVFRHDMWSYDAPVGESGAGSLRMDTL